ncbi:MAG: hypothetical protein AB2728_19765 [Candidatus Thiodiazotropha sp.]
MTQRRSSADWRAPGCRDPLQLIAASRRQATIEVEQEEKEIINAISSGGCHDVSKHDPNVHQEKEQTTQGAEYGCLPK